jgi:hypothetical protein
VHHATIVQSRSVSHDAAEENTDVMSEQILVAGAADANVELAGDTVALYLLLKAELLCICAIPWISR